MKRAEFRREMKRRQREVKLPSVTEEEPRVFHGPLEVKHVIDLLDLQDKRVFPWDEEDDDDTAGFEVYDWNGDIIGGGRHVPKDQLAMALEFYLED